MTSSTRITSRNKPGFTTKEQQVITSLIANAYGVAYEDMMHSVEGDCFMVFAVKEGGKLKFYSVEQTYDESAQGNFVEGLNQYENITYLFSVHSRRLAKINEAIGNRMVEDKAGVVQSTLAVDAQFDRLDLEFNVSKSGLIFCRGG